MNLDSILNIIVVVTTIISTMLPIFLKNRYKNKNIEQSQYFLNLIGTQKKLEETKLQVSNSPEILEHLEMLSRRLRDELDMELLRYRFQVYLPCIMMEMVSGYMYMHHLPKSVQEGVFQYMVYRVVVWFIICAFASFVLMQIANMKKVKKLGYWKYNAVLIMCFTVLLVVITLLVEQLLLILDPHTKIF